MSAHPTPHSSDDSPSSFWPAANIVLAALIGGFALFWGAALLIKGAGLSSGMIKPEAPAKTASAPANAAAPAAAAATPAAAPAFSGPPAEVKLSVDPSNPMAYDLKSFTVKAGQTVKLTFNNVHPVPQPHNVVIGAVGA
ncbi:MAG TPA: hypothetical protein VD994_17110, partial [Prosthecobacter sp.]|nr:hypothetical protein [Prosthecobacter sp.]